MESLERAIAAEAENKRLIEAIRKLPETSLSTVGQAENNKLRAEIERLRKEKERLMIVLNTINDIVSDSNGVAGWHLSGDIASWDSFGFMDAMQEVLKNGD